MMTSKILCSGTVLATLLLAPASAVYSQVPGHVIPFGGETRGITRFTGEIVCAGCSLEEARQAQRYAGDLYVLRHPEGQVVLRIDGFSDPAEHARWESIAGLSHQLTARAPDRVFQELTAEENLFKQVEVTGLLRSNRTFDIGQVRVIG
jgi:hypothetical protein